MWITPVLGEQSGRLTRTDNALPDDPVPNGRSARYLNPPSPKGECGFDPRPGHQLADIWLGKCRNPLAESRRQQACAGLRWRDVFSGGVSTRWRGIAPVLPPVVVSDSTVTAALDAQLLRRVDLTHPSPPPR